MRTTIRHHAAPGARNAASAQDHAALELLSATTFLHGAWLIGRSARLDGDDRALLREATATGRRAHLAADQAEGLIASTAPGAPLPPSALRAIDRARGLSSAAQALLDATEARDTSDECLRALHLYRLALARLDAARESVAANREAA